MTKVAYTGIWADILVLVPERDLWPPELLVLTVHCMVVQIRVVRYLRANLEWDPDWTPPNRMPDDSFDNLKLHNLVLTDAVDMSQNWSPSKVLAENGVMHS